MRIFWPLLKKTSFGLSLALRVSAIYSFLVYKLLSIFPTRSKSFEIKNLKSNVIEQAPKLYVLHNVFLVPEHGAVYSEDGRLIEVSLIQRGTSPKRLAYQAPTTINVKCFEARASLCQTAIYGGYASSHFGHILTESLSRLWLFNEIDFQGQMKILYFSSDKGTSDNSKVIYETVSKSISPIEFCKNSVFVRKLILPEMAMLQNNLIYSSYASFMGRVGSIVSNKRRYPASDRVYLSRRRLSAHARLIINEEILEEKLRALGFDIVCPERLSLACQIAIFSQAKLIVGCIGSAFHTMLLAKEVKAQVIYLVENLTNLNYPNIDKVKSIEATYLKCLFKIPFSLKKSATKIDCYIDHVYVVDHIRKLIESKENTPLCKS